MKIAFPPEMVSRVTASMNKAANEVATEVGGVVAGIVSVMILDAVLKLMEAEKYSDFGSLGEGEKKDIVDYDDLKAKIKEILKDPMAYLDSQTAEVAEEL